MIYGYPYQNKRGMGRFPQENEKVYSTECNQDFESVKQGGKK